MKETKESRRAAQRAAVSKNPDRMAMVIRRRAIDRVTEEPTDRRSERGGRS